MFGNQRSSSSSDAPDHELKKVAKLWKAHVDRSKIKSESDAKVKSGSTTIPSQPTSTPTAAAVSRNVPQRSQTMPSKLTSRELLYNHRARTAPAAPLFSIAEEQSPNPPHCEEIILENDDEDDDGSFDNDEDVFAAPKVALFAKHLPTAQSDTGRENFKDMLALRRSSSLKSSASNASKSTTSSVTSTPSHSSALLKRRASLLRADLLNTEL